MNTITTRSSWLYSLLFICSLLFSADGLAQRDKNEKPAKPPISEEEYNKLLLWLVSDKYENILYKCIRYTENDKTKNEPIPYIRMAQAYLGIHQSDNNELRDKFEADKNKALKTSLKYASKFRKKDKELEYYHEFTEFFDELWSETMFVAETEMDNDKYTRAKSYYKSLCTINPEDPGSTLMLAAVYQHLKSRKEAETTYEKARNLLLEFGDKVDNVQRDLLLFAIIYNIDFLADFNRPAALEWLEFGSELFRGEREFEAVRRSIGG